MPLMYDKAYYRQSFKDVYHFIAHRKVSFFLPNKTAMHAYKTQYTSIFHI